MFLDDVPINYWGVLVAAVIFYVLGAIWYLPCCFGCSCKVKEENVESDQKGNSCTSKVGAYFGEFLVSLVIAYVLALFIEISDADVVVEGITVALWAWIGFVATTHLSPVFWGLKSIRSYFVHAGFLLVGFIAMGAVLVFMS